jgi:hypothetical protein
MWSGPSAFDLTRWPVLVPSTPLPVDPPLTHFLPPPPPLPQVDPRDLQYREIWQFAEPNVSEEIQLMRHAAYMQLREDKMDCVLKARDAIITARAEREALSKAVEAKIRHITGTGGEEDTNPAAGGASVKDGGGSVRSPTKAAAPRAPTSFPADAGFAALYSQAPDAGVGEAKAAKAPKAPSRWMGNEVLVRARMIEAKRTEYSEELVKVRMRAGGGVCVCGGGGVVVAGTPAPCIPHPTHLAFGRPLDLGACYAVIAWGHLAAPGGGHTGMRVSVGGLGFGAVWAGVLAYLAITHVCACL